MLFDVEDEQVSPQNYCTTALDVAVLSGSALPEAADLVTLKVIWSL